MMKALLEVQQITLQVSGREMTFSEKELVSILEKHFATTETQPKEENTQIAEIQQQVSNEAIQTPTEGKWFRVNPTEIDQSLFSKPREYRMQEETRKLILEAFAEMKNNSKYARPFKTLIPERTLDVKYVKECKMIACILGGHMADWVEQALEWAQRIANGETWKAVCNDSDTAKWYRLIEWKSGDTRVVGGSCRHIRRPASNVHDLSYEPNPTLLFKYIVPLVVQYR